MMSNADCAEPAAQRHTIAAVVPLYNGARYIEAAIRSILAQRRPADEIIIVDDGSRDDGPAVVRRLMEEHPRIRLLFKENGGQGSARNFGVRHSTSSLIALLDQDDSWYVDHLEELERPFLANPDPRMAYAYSNLDRVDKDGRMVQHAMLDHIPEAVHPKSSLSMCLGSNMFILPGASLVSRAAFEQVGGFDERLAGYEDDDLFLRLFCAGYVSVYINKPLGAWRIHSGSTSGSLRMWKSQYIYFRKLIEAFPDDPAEGMFWTRDYIAPRFAQEGYLALSIALRRKDPEAAALAERHLADYVEHLSGRRRRQMKRRIWFCKVRADIRNLRSMHSPSRQRLIARDI